MRVLDVSMHPYICLNNKGFLDFCAECGQNVALLLLIPVFMAFSPVFRVPVQYIPTYI